MDVWNTASILDVSMHKVPKFFMPGELFFPPKVIANKTIVIGRTDRIYLTASMI
jgi:hypothetical protein